MTDGAIVLQRLQLGFAVGSFMLAGVAVVWSLVSIIRKRGAGPYLAEFVTIAMSTGVVLWSAKYLVAPGERGSLEAVSTAGLVLFLAACAAQIYLHRRRRDTSAG